MGTWCSFPAVFCAVPAVPALASGVKISRRRAAQLPAAKILNLQRTPAGPREGNTASESCFPDKWASISQSSHCHLTDRARSNQLVPKQRTRLIDQACRDHLAAPPTRQISYRSFLLFFRLQTMAGAMATLQSILKQTPSASPARALVLHLRSCPREEAARFSKSLCDEDEKLLQHLGESETLSYCRSMPFPVQFGFCLGMIKHQRNSS